MAYQGQKDCLLCKKWLPEDPAKSVWNLCILRLFPWQKILGISVHQLKWKYFNKINTAYISIGPKILEIMQILINLGGIALFQIVCIATYTLYSTFNLKLRNIRPHCIIRVSYRTQILTPVFKTQIQFFSLCFNIPSFLLSNHQTETFSNKFYVLYSRENSPWIWGKYGASQAVECSSRAILGFLEPLTPQFPLRRIRTNKLKELGTQNKQSSIQEKLTRDAGGQPKRQRTERLQGHLHQHRRAVPGIFSICLWVPSPCQMVKWQN